MICRSRFKKIEKFKLFARFKLLCYTLVYDVSSYFSQQEREEILNVHVDRWSQKPSSQLLSYLAENAVGYCGSDLKALCSEAVIQGFRRAYPQVYTSEYRLQLEPAKVKVRIFTIK